MAVKLDTSSCKLQVAKVQLSWFYYDLAFSFYVCVARVSRRDVPEKAFSDIKEVLVCCDSDNETVGELVLVEQIKQTLVPVLNSKLELGLFHCVCEPATTNEGPANLDT